MKLKQTAYGFLCCLMSIMLYSKSGIALTIDPLLIGDKVPFKEVKTVEGKSVSLQKLLNNKPTILIFYRGGWCPYCNLHLQRIQKVEKKLIDLGYQIFAISPDLPEFLANTIKKDKLSYTLLSDSSMTLARAFGIAFKADKSTLAKYAKYGIDLEKNSGQTHHLLPVPSVFIVDAKGKIVFTYVNPDYKVRLDENVLLDMAKSSLMVKDAKHMENKEKREEIAMKERPGLVTLHGDAVVLLGDALRVNEIAPDFKAADNGFNAVSLSDFRGKVCVISVVPSLDTPVCSVQTKRFNKEIAGLSDDLQIITISRDLPFAQSRFCEAEGIDKLIVLSDAVWHEFGEKYGVLVKDMGLLSRSIFIVGKDGKLVYQEIVPEISEHPDYANVQAEIAKVLSA